MAKGYRPVWRDQPFLVPPDMREWLPDDHAVWLVIGAVGRLDTSAVHAVRRTGGAGARGYDPQMLVTLLIWAYASGVSSSRRIEELCCTDVAFRVICAQDVPDHVTIARFRRRHAAALAGLFDQVLELCARSGLVRAATIAIDGTKLSGNAGLSANRSYRRIADELLDDAERVDSEEDEQFGDRRGDELPPELADRQTRRARLRQPAFSISFAALGQTIWCFA